jgi:hypothetical protein
VSVAEAPRFHRLEARVAKLEGLLDELTAILAPEAMECPLPPTLAIGACGAAALLILAAAANSNGFVRRSIARLFMRMPAVGPRLP